MKIIQLCQEPYHIIKKDFVQKYEGIFNEHFFLFNLISH